MKKSSKKPRSKRASAESSVSAALPRKGGAPTAAVRVFSEGQRRLLAVPGTLTEIGDNVGCRSPQTVLDWRNGAKKPHRMFRAAIRDAYQIPIDAWDRVPEGSDAPTHLTDASTTGAALGNTPNSVEHAQQLLNMMRSARNDPGMLTSERLKLAESEAKLLALRHRFERDAELLEDRIVREHPSWTRLKAALIEALLQHPQAARAVADVLEKQGM